MSTIQPVILTADHDVLVDFYTKLFGAEEIFRVPEKGPVFYLGLRIGDTDLGLVAKPDPGDREAPRISSRLPWPPRARRRPPGRRAG